MAQQQTREREETVKSEPPLLPEAPEFESVRVVRRRKQKEVPARPHPHERETRERLAEHEGDPRFQHELKEMQETHDLDDVDDDVEDEATLYEWRAEEHTHRPKSPLWFVVLAVGATIVIGVQLFFFANIFGAVTIGFVSALIYYIAQQKPKIARYRIMVDGIAVNNTLWHYRDLDVFNVLYEPDDECKTVIFRSHRTFSPYIHMEIGDADPVEIRDVLLEFLDEDQELDEPFPDVLARRLGF